MKAGTGLLLILLVLGGIYAGLVTPNEAAGLGVAFRAKPVLQRVAAASITHGDLTALLYLQGFCREEFVASSGVPATDVWP